MRPKIKMRDQLAVGVRPEVMQSGLERRYPGLEFVICWPEDQERREAEGFHVVGECRPTTLGNSPRLAVLARDKHTPTIDTLTQPVRASPT